MNHFSANTVLDYNFHTTKFFHNSEIINLLGRTGGVHQVVTAPDSQV
jgi:hypothetical protein